MVFPIVGGDGKPTGYEIENSLRFNDGDNPQLSLSTGTTNKRKFTVSLWAKRSTNGQRQSLWASDKTTNDTGDGSKGGSGVALQFWNDDMFYFGGFGGNFQVRANGLQRDPSAWYHIVGQVDTEQGTTNDRAKLWINGVQQTTYSAMIGQNTDIKFATNRIGRQSSTANYSDSDAFYYDNDGYIAELHVIDGQYYDATYFGEFNSDGVWVPKEYEGSYGSDGYYLEFKQTGTSANSSGIGADTSGNDSHLTPTNLAATDITEDAPTNNFATFSPLGRVTGTVTLSEGNCKIEGSSDANASGQHGTIAFTSGKWYLEMKATDSTTTQLGFLTVNSSDLGDNTADGNGGMNYHYANIYYQYNNSSVNKVDTGGGGISAASVSGGSNSSLGGFSDGDILMFALDMDNNRAYFGKNGTWFNSGNPANGTNYFSLQTDVADGVTFYAGVDSNTGTELNTGNPPFSISSGNNDGKYGNFEYAVPSGYYAMCTKRLAEFG